MAEKSWGQKRSEELNNFIDNQKDKLNIFKKPQELEQPIDEDAYTLEDQMGYIIGYNTEKNKNYDPNNPSSPKRTVVQRKALEPFQPTEVGGSDVSTKKVNIFPETISNFNFKQSALNFEDPTFLTFDIFLYNDYSSALFAKNPAPPYGIFAFLTRNAKISSDFQQRLNIWDEFIKRLFDLFYSTGSDSENLAKSHYIQSIEGIDKFKQPIIKYKEDKITITLVEDVKMTAEYLAELYNNLAYDYKFKRLAIPENCLRFDMAVMISDIRRFKKRLEIEEIDEVRARRSKDTLNKNISREIFILRDCNFNFMNSFNVQSNLTQGGFNQSNPDTSSLQFDIYYKSAERALYPDLYKNITDKDGKLLDNNLRLETHNINLDTGAVFNKNTSPEFLGRYVIPNTEKIKPKDKIDRDNIGGDDTFVDRLWKTTTDTVQKSINNFTDAAISEIRQKKGKLLESFRQEISDRIQVQSLYPDNVYQPDFNDLSLKNFVRGLGGQLLSNLSNEISAELSSESDDILNEVENFLTL